MLENVPLPPQDHLCFGYCQSCQRYHSLPSDLAKTYALELMQQLRQHQRLDFDLPLAQADSRLRMDHLYQGRGQMFGVLVGEDQSGIRHILKAFSCTHNGLWEVQGWVPPVQNEAAYRAVVAEGDRRTRPINYAIETLQKGSPLYQKLHSQRVAISAELTARLFSLYRIRNFHGQSKALFEASIFGSKVAMGTGDCCAPKLLTHAQRLGLKPLSLAEFYMGTPTLDGKRQDGEFYPICRIRCEPILGHLLCGGGE